jgi:hypothetical protein
MAAFFKTIFWGQITPISYFHGEYRPPDLYQQLRVELSLMVHCGTELMNLTENNTVALPSGHLNLPINLNLLISVTIEEFHRKQQNPTC